MKNQFFKKVYRPRRNLKKAAKRSAARRAARKTAVKMMRKIAKAEISKMAEDKEVRLSGANRALYSYPGQTTYASSYWGANNIYDTSIVWAGLSQGTGEGNRIGNKIRIKRFRMSCIIYPITEASTVNQGPYNVRVWVVSSKLNPNSLSPALVYSSMCDLGTNEKSFFDNGSSTNGMVGNLTDLLLPVNTNVWNVHKCMTFKIANSQAPETGNAQGNNDYKFNKKFYIDLKKYQNKVLQFNDASLNQYNKKIWVVFEVLNAAGVVINDVVSNQLLGLTYNYDFRYEDM